LRRLDCQLIYVESIARTQKLSLTGKILYYMRMVDSMMVQWPELESRYPSAQYVGRVY
jgi:beta-1,4-N-acetylglucosaminyltransferase